ncbi:MAG: DEAD/DEAH box helicase [Planctomycetes bacterium]|nr:DEAD/DEAH box helicase [Planctomycetota bacterium]
MSFTVFFQQATGSEPYPYQVRFAEAEALPHLLRAPTGAGKTATAILGWLWRWKTKPEKTPRRLVYCLPMRVLVEQSAKVAREWLPKDIAVHVLMGGADTEAWHLHPEKPAVLIGTQDMLLSRALNRGYAASRFHWPIDFGLLNNDCLWVFDEPQLMANGVSTSAQLAGFRKSLDTFGECPSVWMSATLEPGWLNTIDFRDKFTALPHELKKDEHGDDYDPKGELFKRMTAAKMLAPLGLSLTKEADEREIKTIAAKVLEKHRESDGGQTLVILNTVKRARAVYAALDKLKPPVKPLLVHSRFRPHERVGERDKDGNVIRVGLNDRLQEKGEATKGRIIVATQVVEAGVDITSRTLITELAPWASIVQRIGRCNRTGNDGTQDNPARVYWIDLDTDKQAMPYEVNDLIFAKEQLTKLDGKGVSPRELDDFKRENSIKLPFEHKHVIRRRDLLDLFDTSPDLSGNDIDISRFVRSDDPDTDVQVFWRTITAEGPRPEDSDGRREELCNVPVGQFREFLKALAEKKLSAFVWDHLDREWVKLDPNAVRPGLKVLLPTTAGGYDRDLGWTGDTKATVEAVPAKPEADRPAEATASDPNSETSKARTIAQHTASVCEAVDDILKAVAGQLSESWQTHLRKATRWHDAGKAHAVFQEAMCKLNGEPADGEHWAKSGKNGRLGYSRKHFRHELASALAGLQHGLPFEVAYLIAAHHGKVRLAIRSLPGEKPPPDPATLFALGVRQGDNLPVVKLGTGTTEKDTVLDLSPMQLGGNSWTGRALELLGEQGPFRLAYLEALLRAADQRVSNAEQKGELP